MRNFRNLEIWKRGMNISKVLSAYRLKLKEGE